MKRYFLFLLPLLMLVTVPAHAEKITVAAAADLKFAMDNVVQNFKTTHPNDQINVVYGSSGNFFTQIQQGAPYDVFFSADIEFPRKLEVLHETLSEVKPYALGRLVLWSATMDVTKMNLQSLTNSDVHRIAMANPKHAPYGKRAEEALRSAGLWGKLQSKLVFGENIATTAQLAETGNAQVGMIALSLAMNPKLSAKGGYWLIPANLHKPLVQGYVITKHAKGSIKLAQGFADYIASPEAQKVMVHYGFALPNHSKASN